MEQVYSRLFLNGHLELVPAFLFSLYLPVLKVSVLETVDRKPKFSHFGRTKSGVRNANGW